MYEAEEAAFYCKGVQAIGFLLLCATFALLGPIHLGTLQPDALVRTEAHFFICVFFLCCFVCFVLWMVCFFVHVCSTIRIGCGESPEFVRFTTRTPLGSAVNRA